MTQIHKDGCKGYRHKIIYDNKCYRSNACSPSVCRCHPPSKKVKIACNCPTTEQLQERKRKDRIVFEKLIRKYPEWLNEFKTL